MRVTVFLSSVAVLASMPAAASAQEQITCIYDAFTAEQRTAVATELTKLITDPEAKTDPAIEKMANSTVEKAAVKCRKKHGWSQQQTAASEDYASAEVIASHMRADPAFAGIDRAKMESSVPSHAGKPLPELFIGEPSEAEMQDFRNAAIAAGIAENDGPRLSRAMVYLSMLYRANVAKALFAAKPAVNE